MPRKQAGKRAALAAAVLAVASVGLAGCPGDLDPALRGSSVCDGAAVMKSPTCSSSPSCHSAAAQVSGLDLETANVISRLLGKMPDPTTSQSCGASATPYLAPGAPATGLLIDKINNRQVCGSPMPYPLGGLPAADIACIQQWADAAVAPVMTP